MAAGIRYKDRVAKILIADDDGHIREVVRFALAQAGHEVREAKDGAQALMLATENDYDVIVLDVVMPEADGLEVCRKLRAHKTTPIVFLSSKDEELDRVLGLELGADDYLTKPFSPRELVARVKAVLRRTTQPVVSTPDAELRRGPLSLDKARHACSWNGTAVVLTVTEFALLWTLAKTPGRVFSRQELVDRAYGDDHVITERTVDSHIRRVRQKIDKLGGAPIETIYGLGYRLRDDL